jgi:aarF domain-containing kinase
LGLDDGKPQLGLIDYGQVKKLSKEDRLLLCQLIVALANEDKPEIVRLVKNAGYKSKYMNEELIYKYAKVSFDETSRELTDGKHIQVFMEELQERDPIESLPNEFIMVGRTSIMLRGLAHALQQPRSVAKAWKPIALHVLSEEKLGTNNH